MYTVLESSSLKQLIADALVVGQQRSDEKFSDSTERVLLFIKPVPSSCSNGIFPKEELVAQMKERIVKDLSRRHVPSFLFEVDEIPCKSFPCRSTAGRAKMKQPDRAIDNVNGKKLETLVKKIVNGGPTVRAKMKMTEDEARMMKKYEKFYDIDAVVRKAEGGSAKL
jgi:acetoacetyl-CoA synthetase